MSLSRSLVWIVPRLLTMGDTGGPAPGKTRSKLEQPEPDLIVSIIGPKGRFPLAPNTEPSLHEIPGGDKWLLQVVEQLVNQVRPPKKTPKPANSNSGTI